MKRIARSSMVGVERRAAALSSTVEGRHFMGHAAVFNQRTAIGNPTKWGFYEFLNRSCFNKTLADGADVVLIDSHDPSKPLARTGAGTMTLTTDATGLRVDVPKLPNLTYANDLIENVAIQNVRGMSFGFEVLSDDWTTEEIQVGELTALAEVREILEVRLIEVSTTAFPAYKGTDADVRSAHASRNARTGETFVIRAEALASLGAEIRAGAKLSADSLGVLQDVLDKISAADDAVDAAQPLLAGLMGVPNPDADDGGTSADTDDDDARSGQPGKSTGVATSGTAPVSSTLTVRYARDLMDGLSSYMGLDRPATKGVDES